MKIGMIVRMVLVVAVFAVGFVLLNSSYNRQLDEQEQLRQELQLRQMAAQAALNALLEEQQAIKTQMETQMETETQDVAAAEQLLAASEAQFPPSSGSIDYSEVLFEIAESCELSLFELATSELQDKEIDEVTFQVMTLVVRVQAKANPPVELDDFAKYINDSIFCIIEFIDAITERGEFAAATTELVDMENLVIPSAEEIEDVERPRATITISVYSYKGG